MAARWHPRCSNRSSFPPPVEVCRTCPSPRTTKRSIGQRLRAHRAVGVQARGRDADLGAEAELAAVGEARRGVDHHHRSAQCLATKRSAAAASRGDDHLGVVGAVAADVRDARRRVGRPRARRGSGRGTRRRSRPRSPRPRPRPARACARSRAARRRARAARCSAAGRKSAATSRCTSSVSSALHTPGRETLPSTSRSQRQVEIGGGVDVEVADALVVLDHRHARVLGDEADQALAAARDRQVDRGPVSCSSSSIVLARRIVDQRHRGLGQAGLAQRAVQRTAAIAALRARASLPPRRSTRVAGLQAQRRGVGGHVGARLVDHRDHAERHAHALDRDAVGAASRGA